MSWKITPNGAVQKMGSTSLLGIPGYVISKIPMYIRFWSKRQKDWVRTKRD